MLRIVVGNKVSDLFLMQEIIYYMVSVSIMNTKTYLHNSLKNIINEVMRILTFYFFKIFGNLNFLCKHIVLKLCSRVFKTISFSSHLILWGLSFEMLMLSIWDNTKSFKEQKYEELKIIIQVRHSFSLISKCDLPIFSFSLRKYKSVKIAT